jgi:hypothetical protein
MRFVAAAFWMVLLIYGAVLAESPIPYAKWSLTKAVEVLNSSPWARHEVFTRVIGGVGSGISGEKEIYSTFYVRFLSARPIREAFHRVQQIRSGYDNWNPEEKRRFDQAVQSRRMDFSRWIVVAVSFRSNDPNEETAVRRFFQSQTKDTLKSRAFLSTDAFPQVELAAYFAPRDETVGAKFVFPREIESVPLVSRESVHITFELLEVPVAQPRLRAMFNVAAMVTEDELVF